MSSWKECKLGELGNVITGKTPSSNNPEDWGFEMPFVTPSDYKNYGKYALSSERKLSNYGISRLRNKVLVENSIMVTCIGSDMGKVVMNKIPVITNQQINSIIPNLKIVDSDFLYYRLVSLYETLRVYGSDGTAVPIVNKTDFENIETEIPPLEEQKAIAEVLSSLDDKIDLLHRQNQTLESLAQTLFRQWFEDKEFDGIIGDIIKLQSGYAFKSKDFQDFGIHGVLKIKNISNSIIDIFNTDFIDLTVANKTDEKFKILSGDILFGMTGAEIGKMGIVPKTDKNLWLNQRVGVLREKYLGAKYLAYLQLTSEFGFDYITNTATGSAQPNISASEIEQCPFVKLEVDEIENYSNEISPLFEKIIFNLGQIQTLENLRDTLLPKLLSGEIILK